MYIAGGVKLLENEINTLVQLKQLKNKGKLFTLFFTNQSHTCKPGEQHANGISHAFATMTHAELKFRLSIRFEIQSRCVGFSERDDGSDNTKERACDSSQGNRRKCLGWWVVGF